MGVFVLKTMVTAVVLAAASLLAPRSPAAAGFLVAMPLATMLVLPMIEFEGGGSRAAVETARSILFALPFTLLFFVPFALADRLHLSFWRAYLAGCVLLAAGAFIYRAIASRF
jgi:hypothetical protein